MLLREPVERRRIRRDRDGHHLDYAYTPQKGLDMTFVERRGNLTQDLGPGKPGPCPAEVERRTNRDVTVRCDTLDFTPVDGPGGKRQIDVQFSRDGVPVDTTKVATYKAPAAKRPGLVKRARIHRSAKRVPVVGWARSPGVDHYEIASSSSEGYQRLYMRDPTCRILRLPVTQPGAAVKMTITPVGPTGRRGYAKRLKLRSGKSHIGAPLTRGQARMGRRCGAKTR